MALPPGSRIPGPISLAIWMLRPVEMFEEHFREWGDIYSLNNPVYGKEVIVNHPELVKTVIAGDPEVFLAGEPAGTLRPILGDRSVLLLDGREHHRQRKLLMPPFHGERLGAYADAMQRITEGVASAWEEDKRFSLLPSMQRITLDVILETVIGVRGENAAELRSKLAAFIDRVQSPLGMIWLVPAFQRDLGPFTGWASLKRKIAEIDALLYEEIARARAVPEAQRGTDVLAMLLAARDEEGAAMTDVEIRDELMTLLIAGHETTATALCWAVEEIARRPEVLERVVEEARGVSSFGRASMPYLDAAIKEALRLRPLTPLLIRKTTQDVALREWVVPAGGYIVPCIYLVQRHPEFWDAPAEFRAERFLDRKPDPYAWLPFGGGSRRCIGLAFAMFEMRIVLATIFSQFPLRLTDPPAKVKLRSFIFAPSDGLRVARLPRTFHSSGEVTRARAVPESAAN